MTSGSSGFRSPPVLRAPHPRRGVRTWLISLPAAAELLEVDRATVFRNRRRLRGRTIRFGKNRRWYFPLEAIFRASIPMRRDSVGVAEKAAMLIGVDSGKMLNYAIEVIWGESVWETAAKLNAAEGDWPLWMANDDEEDNY